MKRGSLYLEMAWVTLETRVIQGNGHTIRILLPSAPGPEQTFTKFWMNTGIADVCCALNQDSTKKNSSICSKGPVPPPMSLNLKLPVMEEVNGWSKETTWICSRGTTVRLELVLGCGGWWKGYIYIKPIGPLAFSKPKWWSRSSSHK